MPPLINVPMRRRAKTAHACDRTQEDQEYRPDSAVHMLKKANIAAWRTIIASGPARQNQPWMNSTLSERRPTICPLITQLIICILVIPLVLKPAGLVHELGRGRLRRGVNAILVYKIHIFSHVACRWKVPRSIFRALRTAQTQANRRHEGANEGKQKTCTHPHEPQTYIQTGSQRAKTLLLRLYHTATTVVVCCRTLERSIPQYCRYYVYHCIGSDATMIRFLSLFLPGTIFPGTWKHRDCQPYRSRCRCWC